MLTNLIKEMNVKNITFLDLAQILNDHSENIEAKIMNATLTISELKIIHLAYFSNLDLSHLARTEK